MKSFVAFSLLLYTLLDLSACLEIKVLNGSDVLRIYKNNNAYFQGRSANVYYMEGTLVYPVPRNACSTETGPPNTERIAYVPNYDLCPGTNSRTIESDGFKMMLSFSPTYQPLDTSTIYPSALIADDDFANFLEKLLDDGIVVKVEIDDDYWAFIERIILILFMVIMAAISLAICFFLGIFCTRWCWHRWQERGLTRWRIRQLPQRRYTSASESAHSCSICLEDFQEGEKLRVLPCDHVFHPRCVDEWLLRWKRVCPLCKSLVSRQRNRQRGNNEETASLLSAGASNNDNGRSREYGSTEDSNDLETQMAGSLRENLSRNEQQT